VPIVVAGGKKLPEDEALTLTYKAISDGAAGVDMGRNIFQAQDPVTMLKAVNKVVHENYTDKLAFEYYESQRAR
ncbi:MAG: 3-hydroxy-5-phosphonooxypentane-2,4-dione thiolase LsrF, partial [Oscillospiraceae bacterium]